MGVIIKPLHTGKFHSSYIGMNVCGSAYENGCVVNQWHVCYGSGLSIIITQHCSGGVQVCTR